MTLGEVIRTIRIELDLSLRELSRASNLTPVLLGELERSVRAPTAEQFAAICSGMARLVEPRAKQRAALFRKRMGETE